MASEQLKLDSAGTALIIQDMQNDTITEGGAFSDSGAPAHAKSQGAVEHVVELAAACRERGVPVIHVHYIVEPDAAGLKTNAPLFAGVAETGALVRGTWGAASVDGVAPVEGDYIVEKMR
ncbi:MAG: gluconolactonase, partial [Solirubrobacterales bacterium]|nr:gluconolactonase [Solirubrobacterales bacterium]